LEAVKHRLYSRELRDRSSRVAAEYVLYRSILRVLQLLAPICPHITESIYQQLKPPAGSPRSIHSARWPPVKLELIDEEVEKKGGVLVAVISEIRREKSKRQASMKALIKNLHIYAEESEREIIRDDIETVEKTCNVGSVTIQSLDPASPGTPIQGYPSIRIWLEL
jgi:isoleucyl-tRNA synthetase